MTSRAMRLFGVLICAAFSYQLLLEVPKYVAERKTTSIILNAILYGILGGLAALFLVRFAKQQIWCRKGHTWVYHPPQYSKKNPTKLKWAAYTDCAHCFWHKESYEKEEAQRKHECPSCGAHIPW